MGLGKTCMAILAWRFLKAKSVLIICPASVRGVWPGEIEKWGETLSVQTIDSGKETLEANIIITSYELAVSKAIGKQILKRFWDVAIFDEAHNLGNPESKRTRMCCGSLVKRARKAFFLSGSIQKDKVNNLWPVFRTLCPSLIPSYQAFINKYTRYKVIKRGIKFYGAKNEEELGRIALENFLIRRKKEKVLDQLPKRFEQTVTFHADHLLQFEGSARELEKLLLAGKRIGHESQLARLRRETGEFKIPLILEEVLELLGYGQQGEVAYENCVVFCYHRSVFSGLFQRLTERGIKVVGIQGSTSPKKRKEAIDAFQAKEAQVFLGTFAAAEGITLTATNLCIFAELSWSLSENEQAQDRIYRIGQEKTVWVKHLLLEKSLDPVVYNVYKKKARSKQKVLHE